MQRTPQQIENAGTKIEAILASHYDARIPDATLELITDLIHLCVGRDLSFPNIALHAQILAFEELNRPLFQTASAHERNHSDKDFVEG